VGRVGLGRCAASLGVSLLQDPCGGALSVQNTRTPPKSVRVFWTLNGGWGNGGRGSGAGDDGSGFLLWQVTNRWQAAIRRALTPHDLTHVQFVLLAVLTDDDTDEGLTQATLSQRAGADPMMVSQVVRVLAERDLVERRQDATDRRAVRARATATGRERAREANRAVEDVDETFFGAGAAASRPLAGHLAEVLERSRA